jgi:hypothetical protein
MIGPTRRVRLDAARSICESFAITRNNQNLTKVGNAINAARWV